MSPSKQPDSTHQRMKLVIHAGAHKTATTSLQQWLSMIQEPLRHKNIYYLQPPQINNYSLVERFHTAQPENVFQIANIFYRLTSELQIKKPIEKILLSHESILSYTNMLPKAMHEGFYGSLENSASCLRALSEEYDLSLVFFVRRQDQFLASVYLQYVMRGNLYIDFKKYVSRIGGFKKLSWLSLLDRLRKSLPGVPIRVLPFEIIKNGDAYFLTEFLNACDIFPADDLLVLPLPKSNESISQAALERLLAEGEGMSAPQRRARGLELRREFPTSDFPKSKLLEAEFSRRIVRFYRQENTQLFEEWMPDYAAFSY